MGKNAGGLKGFWKSIPSRVSLLQSQCAAEPEKLLVTERYPPERGGWKIHCGNKEKTCWRGGSYDVMRGAPQ